MVTHQIMVYYYTSKNIKMMRNIIMNYDAQSEVTACEYMKSYVEKCPENVKDSKISWIVETFLGIQRHGEFLKKITSHLSEELTQEDQDYFMIAFYAITFQIIPKDMNRFYKCLFNLSKSLLDTFTSFLGNNEVLTFITQLAQSEYDTNFVTEKIIGPIFAWQPYISEMGHTYAEYLKKLECRRIKSPTIPIQPNVLNRKSKESMNISPQMPPTTPPNSLLTKRKKMLTKSAIDHKLKIIHNKNKEKAVRLLNTVKDLNICTYAKTDTTKKRVDNDTKNDIHVGKSLIKSRISKPSTKVPVVKDTTASLKRINRRIQQNEEQEVQWLQDLVVNFKNSVKITDLLKQDRQETERKRLLDIEKKHLLGQISYEEAVLAKKRVNEEKKKKYEEFLKEKENWEEEIEEWKKEQMEKNRKQVEKLSLIELDMLQAKKNATLKKQQVAEKVRQESEDCLMLAVKKRQDDLERKINMIKEIKILALIAKRVKVPKVVDLTESSGLGFLCEMSIAELQERLNNMKIKFQEDLENRKKQIKEAKYTEKLNLIETKISIKNYFDDRAKSREENKKLKSKVEVVSSTEINELRKVLENRRSLRKQLTN